MKGDSLKDDVPLRDAYAEVLRETRNQLAHLVGTELSFGDDPNDWPAEARADCVRAVAEVMRELATLLQSLACYTR